MNLFEAVKTCWVKYATFSGRASRSEFWYFILLALLKVELDVISGQILEF